MSWISYSALMFLSSNILYLLVKKAQIEKIPNRIYSISFFLFPSIVYLIYSVINDINLFLNLKTSILVLSVGFFWAYLGNYFSLKSIQLATNPGYSLVIQKSYIFITTIIAIIIFNSEISFSALIGMILIVLSIAIISINKSHEKQNSKWIIYAIISHLLFAFGSIMSKYFLNIGLAPIQFLFYISTLVGILNIIETKYNNTKFNVSKSNILILIGIGIFALFFNLTIQYAYKFAPNPGYVVAINTSSIMSLTVLSSIIFKTKLSKKKLIGVFGVVIGIIFIILL